MQHGQRVDGAVLARVAARDAVERGVERGAQPRRRTAGDHVDRVVGVAGSDVAVAVTAQGRVRGRRRGAARSPARIGDGCQRYRSAGRDEHDLVGDGGEALSRLAEQVQPRPRRGVDGKQTLAGLLGDDDDRAPAPAAASMARCTSASSPAPAAARRLLSANAPACCSRVAIHGPSPSSRTQCPFASARAPASDGPASTVVHPAGRRAACASIRARIDGSSPAAVAT